jgi:hypothetical protein
MSRMKLLTARLLVLSLMLFALVVAFPAAADPPPCPESYEEVFPYPPNTPPDHNGNGRVCLKLVPGNGNQGDGTNLKDDPGGDPFA